MVKVEISERRNQTPQKVTIGDHTSLTSWGAIRINKSHFFPSSFQLKFDDKVIYIDPVGIVNAEPADCILITHAHPDHLSRNDIKNLLKSDTSIVCSREVSKKLVGIENDILITSPSQNITFEDFSVDATFAYNVKPVFLWIKAHPKSKENVGYVITMKNGLKIYHAGDTDYVPELNGLGGIDVVLVPIGGDNLTMNEREAAKLVNRINPLIAIPMHYEIHNDPELQCFMSLIRGRTKVVKLS